MKTMVNNVRLSMPFLFEPTRFDEKSDLKFSAHLLIKPGSPQHQVVKDAIAAACKETWKDKAGEMYTAAKAAGKVWALRDGDAKPKVPGYPGMLFVSAKNKTRPLVIDNNKAPVSAVDGTIYPGCYVNASLDIKAGDKPISQVYARLLGIQFAGPGERLAGGVASAEDFEAIPEAPMEGAAPAAGATTGGNPDPFA